MTIPVWLLDFDGVINAISKKPNLDCWPATSWKRTKAVAGGRSWPILYSTDVVDYINSVIDAGLVEVRWHTTWQAEAENAAKAIGLRSGLPIAEAPEYVARNTSDRWWKQEAALRVVEEEKRSLIWTDDDLAYEGSVLSYMQKHFNFLGISPWTKNGLHSEHLNAIDGYIRTNSDTKSHETN